MYLSTISSASFFGTGLEPASRRLQGDQHVLHVSCQIAYDAFVSTVLGGVRDLVAQCRVWIGDADLLALELIGAGIRLVRAVKQTTKLRSSRSKQTGEANDLSRIHIQIGRIDSALKTKLLDGDDGPLSGNIPYAPSWLQSGSAQPRSCRSSCR